MINQSSIGSSQLFGLLKNRLVTFTGNKKLKIYGTLNCKSGKRMKKENRVFFVSEEEAISLGYRPCGHCMRGSFLAWKKESIS